MYRHFGDADPAPVAPVAPGAPLPPASSGQDPLELVEKYAPLAQGLAEQALDASRQVEVLTAQIKNTKELIRRFPGFSGMLRLRLRKLQARKRAAERRLIKQQEGESSTRTYRTLGQVGAVAGIVLVVAVALRVVRR